jgi:hypothetical protein
MVLVLPPMLSGHTKSKCWHEKLKIFVSQWLQEVPNFAVPIFNVVVQIHLHNELLAHHKIHQNESQLEKKKRTHLLFPCGLIVLLLLPRSALFLQHTNPKQNNSKPTVNFPHYYQKLHNCFKLVLWIYDLVCQEIWLHYCNLQPEMQHSSHTYPHRPDKDTNIVYHQESPI